MPLALRPGPSLARAVRARPTRTRTYTTLTREAEEALFAHAELLSEGGPNAEGTAYFGTSMLTIDLDAVAAALRVPYSPALAATLADCVEGSMRVRIRATRWARAEASRLFERSPLGTARIEVRVRLVERALHIDVDLRAPIEVLSQEVPLSGGPTRPFSDA